MFKIIAFDLDGTLADTIPMCMKAFRESVSPYTGHKLSEEEILHTFGLNETGMVKAVAGPNWEAALEDFYMQYEALHKEVTRTFPGISDLLLFLKERKYVLALITGKGAKCCAISLKQLGLSETFDDVLCGSEQAPNKTENMEYLLQKYAVAREEFCYIGDTAQDIFACRNAGVTCFSAAWQKSADAALLEQENPGHVFYRVKDLLEFFRCIWQ